MSLIFWKRVSNYSAIIIGILVIDNMFFKKYISLPEYPLGIIPLITLVIAELMKYNITHRK